MTIVRVKGKCVVKKGKEAPLGLLFQKAFPQWNTCSVLRAGYSTARNPENKLDLGSRTIDGTKHQVLMNTRYLNPYRLEDFKVLKDNIKEMQQFTKLSVSNLVDSIVELRNLDPLAHDQLEMYADEESTKKLVDAWKTQPMISDDGDSSFDRPDTPRSSACETSYSGASSGALSDHEDSKLQQVEFSVNALKRDFVLLNQDIKEIFALLNKSKKSRRR